MKQKFEIKNILGNSQKRTYRREVFRQRRAGFVLCLIIMAIIACPVYAKYRKLDTSKPVGQTIEQKVVVNAVEQKPYCKDAISCIRDVGEKLGKSNTEIRTMIRIAQKESHMNPKAKNKTSSASGLFQIIAGTWYSNDCTGDKWNYEDNIKCAWKIQSGVGYRAWEVCNNGLAECF